MRHFCIRTIIGLISISFLLSSCKKDWLDAKPQKSLVVPSTIADFQALLDNNNGTIGFNVNYPALDEIGAGDFYVSSSTWASLPAVERNTFIWASDIYGGETGGDWNGAYKLIFSANVVLEGIDKLTPTDINGLTAWNNVKGSALFFRGMSHYFVAKEFCKPYDIKSASNDVGIPLRLSSDFNVTSIRSSVEKTYSQILSDFKSASELLPVSAPASITNRLRPTKAAAEAALARVYLDMQNYDSALVHASQAIQMYSSLINFNTLNSSSTYPFQIFNNEVLMHIALTNYAIFRETRLIVDSALYKLYNNNDLRRAMYFTTNSGNITFRGSYIASRVLFGGLAVDEVYLIRAECYARKSNTANALQDLNTLLITRWKTGTFVPFTASDASDALSKVLVERRKELCFRGLRWADLRRLNKESGFSVTLSRFINNQTYTLSSGDQHYVLPIPDDVIKLSGMPQNPR